MSGVYVYCITPPGSCDGLEIASVTANPVTCREVAGLTVWAEASAQAPPVTVETIRAHDAVVKAVWARTPACVPVRFGQWVASSTSLEQGLGEQRAELERALARVSGAGEHGVRISEARTAQDSATTDDPRPNTGRAYLEWLRAKARRLEEHERRGRELGATLAASLEGLIRAQRVDPLPPDEGLVTVAHLVSRAREAEYAVAVQRFRDARPELHVLLTGPWPPYSFGP